MSKNSVVSLTLQVKGQQASQELKRIATDQITAIQKINTEQQKLAPIQAGQINNAKKISDELRKQAKWYNTLTSNCTTLVFDMVQAVSKQPLPSDYRLLASGYLPNYLNDLGAIDQNWDMKTWYQKAHVNTRTQEFSKFEHQSSENYSQVLRYGLPQSNPALAP